MIKKMILLTGILLFTGMGLTPLYTGRVLATCQPKTQIFLFPTWYKYLDSQTSPDPDPLTGATVCQPKINGINDIWKVVAAVLELLLRLATLIAIGFVVYGGVTYTLSQGAPDKTKQALTTIIDALVGLVIAIVATALVSFIAGRF